MQENLKNATIALQKVIDSKDDLKTQLCGQGRMANFLFDNIFEGFENTVRFLKILSERIDKY